MYKPTKDRLTLTDWWCILNARLVDAGHEEAGFKEAREPYLDGQTPQEAAANIRADRAEAILAKDGRRKIAAPSHIYIENTANLWRR